MTRRHVHVRRGAGSVARGGCADAHLGEGGFTLVDLLVATAVALVTLAVVSTALPPVLDAVETVPEAVDLQQRARATESALATVVSAAGAGGGLLGEGPLSHAVPAVWPRRLLTSADPPGTAWADRLSVLRVELWAAQAPLASAIPAGSTAVSISWHPACGADPSCGFRRGTLVIVYSRTGAMVIASLAAVQGLVLTLGTAPDQDIGVPAVIAELSAQSVIFDAVRRQVRRSDGQAPTQPVTDDVVGVGVRYYGGAAPPRWPAVPGVETCAVAADGTPKLGLLGPVPGPPIELTLADLTDGPWCGTGEWRFDADLLRVRAVRLALRLQATSPGVRGLAPQWFAIPGQSRRPGREVRDVELDVFVTPPNLAWSQ
jgi:type II secretory pathway pseudopilin PulG